MATIVNAVLDIVNERVFPNSIHGYEVCIFVEAVRKLTYLSHLIIFISFPLALEYSTL